VASASEMGAACFVAVGVQVLLLLLLVQLQLSGCACSSCFRLTPAEFADAAASAKCSSGSYCSYSSGVCSACCILQAHLPGAIPGVLHLNRAWTPPPPRLLRPPPPARPAPSPREPDRLRGRLLHAGAAARLLLHPRPTDPGPPDPGRHRILRLLCTGSFKYSPAVDGCTRRRALKRPLRLRQLAARSRPAGADNPGPATSSNPGRLLLLHPPSPDASTCSSSAAVGETVASRGCAAAA
jgi:hypothetical protein